MEANLSFEEQIEADLRALGQMEAIEQAKYTPLIINDSKLMASEEWQKWKREAQKKKKAERDKRHYQRKKAELLATGYDPRLFDGRIKRVTVKKIVIGSRNHKQS